MKNIKVVFMGTPDFSVSILKMLIEETNVILVVSQKDAFVGRKKELTSSPVKKLALDNNIPVFTPDKIRYDYQTIIDLKPDIIITCAYGQIIPKELLNCPKLGCINVHASLLPKLRGGAPIHHAIIDGYDTTGITIMYMDEQMDTGDIISQKEVKIELSDNVGTLHDKLSLLGTSLLKETLPSIINKTNNRIKQNNLEATYAYTIKREEELISFNDTSKNVFNKVRGLNPSPLSYFILNNEETKIIECKIIDSSSKERPGTIINYQNGLEIKTIDGSVLLTKIKPFGKKIMVCKDFLNGIKDKTSLTIKNDI